MSVYGITGYNGALILTVQYLIKLFQESLFISDTWFLIIWPGLLMAAAYNKSLVALWIRSSVVFIKMMTKKLSVQHPTINLPHSHPCSHDLLALRHTEAHIFPSTRRFAQAHTNPSGCYVTLQCNSERFWKFKLLNCEERKAELTITIMPF